MIGRFAVLAVASSMGLWIASACTCQAPVSACQEVAQGSMVFIGTVESIAPHFLDHWNAQRRQALEEIIESDRRFREANSGVGLDALKQKLRETLPDLPDLLSKRLASAKTHGQVVDLFDDVLNRGRTVRFRVKTLFAHGGDDDDKDDNKAGTKDDDDGPASAGKAFPTIEITTPFGDCGYDFQLGETYLVYAVRDEDSAVIETDACTGTKRLADAGADLPFLYFYKNNNESSGHLEGVANYRALLPTKPDSVSSDEPVPGLVIGVSSAKVSRYTVSDAQGKFVFDGLAPGSYVMNAWASGYPDSVKVLAGPYEFQVRVKSCLSRTVVVSKEPSAR